MPKLSKKQLAANQQLADKIVAIKESGLLPRGYAKTIADKLGVSESVVYNVANGRNMNEAVVDELLELAEAAVLQRQTKRADKILKMFAEQTATEEE